MKKKVIILGPISNTGGRAVEAREIFQALSPFYDVCILSTERFYSDLISSSPLCGTNYQSVDKLLYNSHWIIRIISHLSWLKNFFKGQPRQYVNSKFNKRFIDLNSKKISLIKKYSEKADLIFLLMQIESNYLKEIIEFGTLKNIPVIFRPTGEISLIPSYFHHLIQNINKIICHSSRNVESLKSFSRNLKIIDQNAFEEERLTKLLLEIKKPLIFGFLGRFSSEKGGVEITKIFSKRSERLILGGDGPDKKRILKIIEKSDNCQYLGKIQPNQVDEFMKKIDVLIIPSKETETGPYTGIEAMAAGKIIFSTRVGAMEDRLRGTANNFWFDMDNPNTLPELIGEINQLSEEELLNICSTNRMKYYEDYSRDKISKLYVEECRSLLQ